MESELGALFFGCVFCGVVGFFLVYDLRWFGGCVWGDVCWKCSFIYYVCQLRIPLMITWSSVGGYTSKLQTPTSWFANSDEVICHFQQHPCLQALAEKEGERSQTLQREVNAAQASGGGLLEVPFYLFCFSVANATDDYTKFCWWIHLEAANPNLMVCQPESQVELTDARSSFIVMKTIGPGRCKLSDEACRTGQGKIRFLWCLQLWDCAQQVETQQGLLGGWLYGWWCIAGLSWSSVFWRATSVVERDLNLLKHETVVTRLECPLQGSLML